MLVESKIDRFEPQVQIGMLPLNSLPTLPSVTYALKRRFRIVKQCGLAALTDKVHVVMKILKQKLDQGMKDEESISKAILAALAGIRILYIFI